MSAQSFIAELVQGADRPSPSHATAANDSPADVAQFRQLCETWTAAISGQHGNQTTFDLAHRGRELALSEHKTYEVMRDVYNPRCQPQWGDGELYQIVNNAYTYKQTAAGSKTSEAIFANAVPQTATIAAAPVVTMDEYKKEQLRKALIPGDLKTNKKGDWTDALSNLVRLLMFSPEWKDNFIFDQFAGEVQFTRRPLWREDQLNTGLEVSSYDLSQMLLWLSNKGIETNEKKLITAMESNNVAKPVHPVRAYIKSLTWDGTPRLDRILVDTLGAPMTPYTTDTGKSLLIAACARVFEPGCKADDVAILEGAQGLRKSMWISTLAGEWGSTGQLIRGDKDTYQNLRGQWIVELPEINATFSKADFNWLKGILSTATDTYRPSYERRSRKVPRESIFIGTINPGADKQYLKDDENRRYLPITCGGVNIELLVANRDQYFAEAYHRYRGGEPWWITDPYVAKLAKQEQEIRREKDPLIEILRCSEWLRQPAGVTPAEVYRGLGYTAGNVSSHHRRRVYSALQQLGYEYKSEMATGGVWVKTQLTWDDVL